VEVAGIEPASFACVPGLLRAQPAVLFSAPAVTQASCRRAQLLSGVPIVPAAGAIGGASSRCQIPGRRQFRADRPATYLGSKSKVGALDVGTYWLTAHGYRDHRRVPRPASPDSTIEVETVHPLWSCVSTLPNVSVAPVLPHRGTPRATRRRRAPVLVPVPPPDRPVPTRC
jgi:hypothetical protein